MEGPLSIVVGGWIVYFAEPGNRVVRAGDLATGAVATVLGVQGSDDVVQTGALPGLLSTPYGITLLPDGRLAIADFDQNAVLLAH